MILLTILSISLSSASGYFKKITPQSLRMSSEHKLKEDNFMRQNFESTNKTDLIFFTDRAQVYKSKASAFRRHQGKRNGRLYSRKACF